MEEQNKERARVILLKRKVSKIASVHLERLVEGRFSSAASVGYTGSKHISGTEQKNNSLPIPNF